MANSNPAFSRIERDARSGYAGFNQPSYAQQAAGQGHTQAGYPQQPGSTQGYGQQPMYPPQGQTYSPEQLQHMYSSPSAGPAQTGRVTMDDVIVKSLGLFAIVLAMGAVGWFLAATNPGLGMMVWLGAMIGTLVVGLIIAFKKTLSVPLILTYAVFQGLFVGAVSMVFEAAYGGIVGQAVLATISTFVGMFAAYKFGLIKVTEKFRRIVTMMIFGYAIFAVVNFIFAMVTSTPFGFGGSSWIGVAISLFAVGLAAVSLALDFDSIDYAIATGAPKKYSWLLAHGLIVTLVWLYIEFLRLLGRLRS